MKNSEYISVGKILNFHGVQGEAKVGYSKNQKDFLANLKLAYILIENEYLIRYNLNLNLLINKIIIEFGG